MKVLYYIALTLVIIGAINWLLIGLFNFDLVATIFGAMSVMSRYSRTNKYWTLFKSKWLIFSIKIKMILYKNFGISLLVGAPSDSSKGELDLVFYNIIFLYKFSSQNTFARLTLPFVKNMSLYL